MGHTAILSCSLRCSRGFEPLAPYSRQTHRRSMRLCQGAERCKSQICTRTLCAPTQPWSCHGGRAGIAWRPLLVVDLTSTSFRRCGRRRRPGSGRPCQLSPLDTPRTQRRGHQAPALTRMPRTLTRPPSTDCWQHKGCMCHRPLNAQQGRDGNGFDLPRAACPPRTSCIACRRSFAAGHTVRRTN